MAQRVNGCPRCRCCGATSIGLKTLNATASVAEKEIMISEMIGIFKLPDDIGLSETDALCTECMDQLLYGYQFFVTIIATAASYLSPKPVPVPLKCTPSNASQQQCCFCEEKFKSKVLLEKHVKVMHPTPTERSFRCGPCEKTFKTNRGMLQHNKFYHDANESATCHICERAFTNKANHQNHMSYHRDFLCNFCNAGWLSEKKLLHHVRTAHLDRLFVCRFCGRTERLKKCLNRHVRSTHHLPGNPFYCGHCREDSTAFDTFESLTDHLQEQHTDEPAADGADAYDELSLTVSLFAKDLPALDPLHEADEAGKEQEQFLQNLQLTRCSGAKEKPSAVTQQPGEMPLNRRTVLEDFLDEAFENDEIWKKYIENGEEYLIDDYDIYLQGDDAGLLQAGCPYRCPRCDVGFQKQFHLTVHMAESHDIASLVCNDCEVGFTRLQAYRAHRKEHLKENVRIRENNIPEVEEALSLVQTTPLEYSVHEEETGYRFTCKLCDRGFQRKHNLERHNCRFYGQTAETEEAGQRHCTQCDFRTHSAKELLHHQRTQHHQPMLSPDSIYCALCDRRFSSTSGLKYHLKRHKGVKAFTCLYCGKKFTASTNLNAHIRNVHSETKAHRCEECYEAFATKDHLNKHQRSRHRQERAFVCSECGKGYFQQSHLNEHVAACHRECRYPCPTCSKSFVSQSSLNRHQLRKHPHQMATARAVDDAETKNKL